MQFISDMIAGDIAVLSKNLENKLENTEEIANYLGFDTEIIKNSQLKKIGSQRNTRIHKILKKSLENKKIKKFYISNAKNKINVFVESENKSNTYKLSFLKKKLYSRTTPLVIIWGTTSSIVLLIIAFIFLKNQIRPIKRLAEAAELFGKGIDNNYYKPEGAMEVRQAWNSFYKMKSSIKKLLTNRINLLAGISHDLRTPLTRIRLQIAVMPQSNETKDLLKDIDIMTEIINSFMHQAREHNNESFTEYNLLEILQNCAKNYTDDNFQINITGDNSLHIHIKYTSFKRAIENIISNAKKHSNKLFINFEKNQFNEIIINLEDNGQGIDKNIKNDIFMPFISSNKARTMSDKSYGIGLGLSIAKNAVEDHGGSITASDSKKYGGAKFTVTVPKNR